MICSAPAVTPPTPRGYGFGTVAIPAISPRVSAATGGGDLEVAGEPPGREAAGVGIEEHQLVRSRLAMATRRETASYTRFSDEAMPGRRRLPSL